MPLTIEQQAAAATAKLAEMTEAYKNSPEQVAQRARSDLEKMRGDPNFADRAKDVANMEIRAAALSASAARDESQRIAAIMRGERVAAQTTQGDQLRYEDLAGAMVDLTERGINSDLLQTFIATGGNNLRPEEHAAAKAMLAEYERRLYSDPEMQRRLAARDPEAVKQFTTFSVYKASLLEK